MRVRKITMPVYFSIAILYLEMVFHIYEFRSLSGGFFFMTLFSVMGGVLIGALIGKMRERAAYIVTIVVTAALCLFFCAEIVQIRFSEIPGIIQYAGRGRTGI